MADDVIVNTGTLEDLEAFVQTLHRNYLLIAEARQQAAGAESPNAGLPPP
jgi:hypothetical protein